MNFLPEKCSTALPYLQGRVFLYANDFITKCLQSNPVWEPHVLRVIDQCVTPQSVAMDIGAHLGLHTIYLAQRSHSVYAFELVPETYRLLKINVKMNQLKNVYMSNVGLSATSVSKHTIYLPSQEGFSNTGCARLDALVGIDKPVPTSVQLMSLDDWEERHPLTRLDFIKIDVEGHEQEVLAGAKRVLSKFKPTIVMENFEPDRPDALLEMSYVRTQIENSSDYLYTYIQASLGSS
jgi:FkbM family methyltransferase